ncbi:hypothetical protein CORMATOL_01692 [Corynebacterium matruchotii ATCC 33806]|uniref:Uncharacterized protein n=1 Tax=Corynebacterium matruchotii ATCC 33806 TaxID=566549 RepID=C0E3X2_9CORY|nr:hypothetical protein CORMATOL_01692 [Corynebacterium matruchotii ATCC 33806]
MPSQPASPTPIKFEPLIAWLLSSHRITPIRFPSAMLAVG